VTTGTKQAKEKANPPLADASGSEQDDAIWRQAKAEHDAAGKILDALRPVSQAERRRILAYLWDKYVLNPEPPNAKVSGGGEKEKA
jgi:hypothetical protein